MRITIESQRTKLFLRYSSNCTLLSTFSPKTLNPMVLRTTLHSNSVIAVSSLCHPSSGSSLFFSSESYSLQTRPTLIAYSSVSTSALHFGLHSLKTKQPLGSSSSGPASNCFPIPYLHISSAFLTDSRSCRTDSHSYFKNLSLFHFSSALPSRKCTVRSVLLSICSLTPNSHFVCFNYGWPHCGNFVRCYTRLSSNSRFSSGPLVENQVQGVAGFFSNQIKLEERNNFPKKCVLEVVDILRNNGKDIESRLNILHSRLSINLISEIFEVLNCQRISGLRFFEWIWNNNPQLHKNAYACSLIIDNLGRLDDYQTMYTWFEKFTSEKICLRYEAFRFLSVLACTDSSVKESTKRVIDLLNRVGGSCRGSGVCALVEMFCKLHMFEMARYVIKITESKISYYCLLIREKCGSGLIGDAYNVIKEMRQTSCAPNTAVYNYILGSLWKNGRMGEASALLDEMKINGITSDEITFEILINSACSLGSMDAVYQLLDQMASQGLEPRTSTHACIIKTFFAAEEYEAAYKHVVDSSINYKTSSNMMYSLLAKLYREKGEIMSAWNTLVEMMEKGLKPDFNIYIKIVKQLSRTGKANLVRDLEIRHSKFDIKSRARLS